MTKWPQAPAHVVDHPGIYIVTAATYHKFRLFDTDAKLDLLETLGESGWQVQAWAVLANYYHYVGFSPDSGLGLTAMTRRIHGYTARELNRIDGTPGREVWYRCWDTRISFERSYLARLAYVHNNPVKHGLVSSATEYPRCSASWFASNANRAFYETVSSFKTDRVVVYDDF